MLSETEQQVWDYMMEYQDQYKKPPTMEEIAVNTTLAGKSGSKYILGELLLKGYVITTTEGGTSRRYMALEPKEQDPIDLVSHFVPEERL